MLLFFFDSGECSMNHLLYLQIPQNLIENFTMRPFFKSEKSEDCALIRLTSPLNCVLISTGRSAMSFVLLL